MRVAGIVRPPGDKSITHRALALAAVASGESIVRDPLASLDTESMAGALRKLGASISPLDADTDVIVSGVGLGELLQPVGTLDCGNSGTAARLLIGMVGGCPITARLTGDESLRTRPMRRVTAPLMQMGAIVQEENGDGLPLSVTGGSLRPLEYDSATASAQVKSALLLAGLMAQVEVSITEPVRSRDHTERMLSALGVAVTVHHRTVLFDPADSLRAFDVRVPGDPSSAAFLIGAALLASRGELVVRTVSINPTRIGFIGVLHRMGARLEVRPATEELGEPIGDLLAAPSHLEATEVTAEEIPSLIDEIPLLAVLASRASGRTVFRGVAELRHKESNRLTLLASNLRAVGAAAYADSDTLEVEGTDRPPRGRIETGGDHRMAMAFSVLGAMDGASVILSERQSPNVSYPRFFSDLEDVLYDD